jgi:hypothetical protein
MHCIVSDSATFNIPSIVLFFYQNFHILFFTSVYSSFRLVIYFISMMTVFWDVAPLIKHYRRFKDAYCHYRQVNRSDDGYDLHTRCRENRDLICDIKGLHSCEYEEG